MMRRFEITEEIAGRLWDVLVAECGAPEKGRQEFIASASSHNLTEYRFMGALGFGGKVHYAPYRGQAFYVSCYPEDSTPERVRAVRRANDRLANALAPRRMREEEKGSSSSVSSVSSGGERDA